MLHARAPFEGLHSVVGAFLPASKNERLSMKAGAMGLGETVRRNLRRIEGCLDMGRDTSQRRRSTFVRQTTGGPALGTSGAPNISAMTEEETAKKFSALVIPYSKGDLARAASRTKEAAKHWKDGTRAPNSSSLITLGRRIPRIKEWVIAEMNEPVPVAVSESQDPQAQIALLQLAATFPGQTGALARALLKQMNGGN